MAILPDDEEAGGGYGPICEETSGEKFGTGCEVVGGGKAGTSSITLRYPVDTAIPLKFLALQP